jgi:hypothetical protein
LLTKYNEADGTTTPADLSSYTKTTSSNTGCEVDTASAKWGTGSLLITTSSAAYTYALSDDFAFGADDFALEMWIQPKASTAAKKIIGPNGGPWIYYSSSNRFAAYLSTFGYFGYYTYTPDQWYHLALTRSGSTFRFFVDGELIEAIDYTVRYGASGTFAIAGYAGTHIDSIRVTRGIARYTATFTVPTTDFPETGLSPLIDPYWDRVILLLQPSDAVGTYTLGATLTDDSSFSRTIDVLGTSGETTTVASSSAKFEKSVRSDNYLSTPYSTDFAFANKSFTIEGWFLFDSQTESTNRTILRVNRNSASNIPFQAHVGTAGTLYFSISNGTTSMYTITGTKITPSTWIHLAFVRDPIGLRIYMNGTRLSSSTSSTTDIASFTEDISILGTVFNDYPMSARTEQLRVTAGIARYTANFTPPTAPFPTIGIG